MAFTLMWFLENSDWKGQYWKFCCINYHTNRKTISEDRKKRKTFIWQGFASKLIFWILKNEFFAIFCAHNKTFLKTKNRNVLQKLALIWILICTRSTNWTTFLYTHKTKSRRQRKIENVYNSMLVCGFSCALKHKLGEIIWYSLQRKKKANWKRKEY